MKKLFLLIFSSIFLFIFSSNIAYASDFTVTSISQNHDGTFTLSTDDAASHSAASSFVFCRSSDNFCTSTFSQDTFTIISQNNGNYIIKGSTNAFYQGYAVFNPTYNTDPNGNEYYQSGDKSNTFTTDGSGEYASGPTITPLSPIADSYIQQCNPNENEGAATFLSIQQSGHNRGLLKFNQSQIQSAVGNSSNYTAKLELIITKNGNNWGSNSRTINLHRLNQDWIEGNGFGDGNPHPSRGTGSGITWSCAIDSNISNSATNCNKSTNWNMTSSNQWPFKATPTASIIINNNQLGLITLDVTSDIKSFLNNSSNNYGWILKKSQEDTTGKVLFGSKESSTPPRLVITKY